MSHTDIPLRPLQCTNCGALVPLGREAVARCPYCRHDVAIPQEYHAIQRASVSFADDRKLARDLYGRVGKPPGPFALVLMRHIENNLTTAWLDVIMGLLVSGFGFFILPPLLYLMCYPIGKLVRLICMLVHYPVHAIPAGLIILPTSIVFLIIAAALRITVDKERELANVRRDIHASLAAAPPEYPGGPGLCRNCNAALDVPASALGVPCPYCRADNLVALSGEWVRYVRSSEFGTFRRIDAALEAHRRALDRAREKRWLFIFGMILMFPVMVGLTVVTTNFGLTY